MYATDYLRKKRIKIIDMNKKEILKSERDIKINEILPFITEGVNITKAAFRRASQKIKEVDYGTILNYGWVVVEDPVMKYIKIGRTPYYPSQKVRHFLRKKTKAIATMPSDAVILNQLPEEVKILMRLDKRLIKLKGRTTGNKGVSKKWVRF